jgi:tetratricopeptide (TPR) repeat protein
LLQMPRTNQAELLSVEASAHLAKNDLPGAEATIEKALAKYPGDEDLMGTATQVYLNHGRYSNAIVIIDKELNRYPDNMNALVTKGYACLQLGAFQDAIAPLTRVLELETNNSEIHFSALLNRAIAYLRSERLDEAQRDYEVLQKAFPTAFRVYFGLGDIAYQRQKTNDAIRYYQLYLANSPTNTEEAKFVIGRLKELKPHTP